MRKLIIIAGLLAGTVTVGYSAAFTPGDVVIYRVGDGTAALSSAATAVFLDEYSTGGIIPAGTLVQSIPMPTATSGSNSQFVASGSATSEGLLTTSLDGRYLTLTGYSAAVGTTGVASSSQSRVVGRVAGDGTVDTSTVLTDASTNNVRSAVTTNGTDIWFTTGSAGVRYTTFGSTTSTALSITPPNFRAVNIFGGQLYVTSSSGTTRLATVGTGLPTTSGQTVTNLTGTPTTGSPYQFAFADLSSTVAGLDTLYVADDAAGLEKFSFDGTAWTLTSTTAITSLRGLTLSVGANKNVSIFGTSPTNLYTLVDSTGYNMAVTATPTSLVTAGTNTAFRGVAFTPGAVPEPSTWAMMLTGLAGLGLVTFRRRSGVA